MRDMVQARTDVIPADLGKSHPVETLLSFSRVEKGALVQERVGRRGHLLRTEPKSGRWGKTQVAREGVLLGGQYPWLLVSFFFFFFAHTHTAF